MDSYNLYFTENRMLGLKTFRLFLSSTFSDLVVERDELQSKVFPGLKKYCEQRDGEFRKKMAGIGALWISAWTK